MMKSITNTQFRPLKLTDFYRGKVRDVYTINEELLVMVTTDRISAFDVVLPRGIPYKGQVLNQVASYFLDSSASIVPNWKIAQPDPMVLVGRRCAPFKVEMVIRGYLAGHAWREYKAGRRMICGMEMPGGMIENDKFPQPIITPTTKASVGHDEDISREEIIDKGIVEEGVYRQLEHYTRALFDLGTRIAAERGLILVDTKYEFGSVDDQIFLIDEIHTPDSSRYFYLDGYAERQKAGQPQRQLSKEFVREWLMDNGFQGKEGQVVPEMTDDVVDSISARYIELYEKITGMTFVKAEVDDVLQRVERNICNFLEAYYR